MTAPQLRVAAPSSATRPIPGSAYFHLFIVYVVWGCTYFAVKIALTGPALITPVQMQSLRMWLGAGLLALVTWMTAGIPRGVTRRDLALCATTGILMWVTGNGLATLSARHANSSFIVMALGTIPLWSVALECLAARTMPNRRVVLPLLMGLAGLALVLAPALASAHGAVVQPGHAVAVILMLVGAGITWSLGTVLQRPLADRLSPGWIATFQMATAAMVLTLLAGLEHAPFPLHGYGMAQLLAFAFLVVFGSVISLSSYVIVTRSFSATVASTFAYVNPIIGMVLGFVFLRESIAPLSLAGFGVVLASVTWVLRRKRP